MRWPLLVIACLTRRTASRARPEKGPKLLRRLSIPVDLAVKLVVVVVVVAVAVAAGFDFVRVGSRRGLEAA